MRPGDNHNQYVEVVFHLGEMEVWFPNIVDGQQLISPITKSGGTMALAGDRSYILDVARAIVKQLEGQGRGE